jgi:hypothetical protein
MEDGAEVVEPDVLAVLLDKLEQAVLLERELDEVVDRVAENRRQDEDDRQNEEVWDRPAGDTPAGQPPPPRPCGRGGGGERGGLAPAQERSTAR